MFPLILHGFCQVLGCCPRTILHPFPPSLLLSLEFRGFSLLLVASTVHAMSLDRGALVDHWNWPVSPGHQRCDRWTRRLWPSLALGHVGGLGGHPVQRFANATARMVMNKNYKGRGAIGYQTFFRGKKPLGF